MQPNLLSTSPFFSFLQEDGATALTFASQEGHTEVIKSLLSAPDIDVNHADVSTVQTY